MGFSKYEILEKVVQATRDKNVTVEQIEKELKKIKAKSDHQNQTYSETVTKAVVDHFELIKKIGKSDKAKIAYLVKQNKQLIAALPQLKMINEKINNLDQKITDLDQKFDQVIGENNSNPNEEDYVQNQLPLDNQNSDNDSAA